MTGRLAGKTSIITGIGNGIGRAAALLFAREGAQVVGCDIQLGSCQKTVEDIRSQGGLAVGLDECDVRVPAQADALVDLAIDSFGRVDTLFNNAAFAQMAWVEDMTHEMWRETMVGELDIVFNMVKSAWAHLKKSGGGSIISCASVSGKIAYKDLPAFAHTAGKGGVIALTRHLAMEGGKHAIRCNSISPGLVQTAATAPLIENGTWLEGMKHKLMLNGRVGTPEDIAYCALYLASEESCWVTGADFAIDGGTTAW